MDKTKIGSIVVKDFIITIVQAPDRTRQAQYDTVRYYDMVSVEQKEEEKSFHNTVTIFAMVVVFCIFKI